MPAKSDAQRKFFNLVRQYKDGKLKPAEVSDKVKKAAKSMSDKDIEDFASTEGDLPDKVKEERDYKDEYKKFQSSTKSKKYRTELNKYNRQKGTYGNGDGKDASHKNGKIAGFESESKNRGRREKSRVKKEDILRSTIRRMIKEEIYSATNENGEYTVVSWKPFRWAITDKGAILYRKNSAIMGVADKRDWQELFKVLKKYKLV